MKKPTLRDIAAQAGVSVATVSYVLSNNEKETIAETTRQNILNIAKELGYVPNLVARSLTKGKSGMIGILIADDWKNRFEWKINCYSELINVIEKKLAEKGYHVLISFINVDKPNVDVIMQRKLDGVFLIDFRKELFYTIAKNFKVPIVLIDSYIDDYLFQKVVPGLGNAICKAKSLLNNSDSILIAHNYFNDEIKEQILNTMRSPLQKQIYFMESLEGLEAFIHNNRHIEQCIVINEFIGCMVSRYISSENMIVIGICGCSNILPKDVRVLSFNNEFKGETAVNTMLDYVDGIFYKDKYIVLEAD
ncbi:MAG: hypothetical protein K0R50_3510 [Eubacterium sp.]|nr:hypothetical protein [Eubacterium sp.]